MVWQFIGVYIINRTLHGRLMIRNFSSRVEKIFHSFAALSREIFFNSRRQISYLRAAMQYPLCTGFLFRHSRSFYFRTCFIYPAAEFEFIYIASIVVYWPTFSLMFLIHLSLYEGVYRTFKSDSERNTLNYSQSDHDSA